MARIFLLDQYWEMDSFQDILEKLGHNTEISIDTSVIFRKRETPLDLVIAEFAIKPNFNPKTILYSQVPWQKTGLEFFRRTRTGEYLQYGFLPGTDFWFCATGIFLEEKDKMLISELGANWSPCFGKPLSRDTFVWAVATLLKTGKLPT